MRPWMITLILIGLLLPETGLSDIYYWVDNQGIQNYTARLESVPEEYRSKAEQLSLPPTPPPPPEMGPSPPAKGLTKIPFTPGSPLLVNAKINGLGPFRLLLDTGADRTVISPSVQSRMGLSLENGLSVTLQTLTGMGQANGVWVDFIEVGETRVGPLFIVVYATDLKGADGLLGRDFLSHLNLSIDSKEKVVTLTPN